MGVRSRDNDDGVEVEGAPRGHDDVELTLSIPGVSIINIRWEHITSLTPMRDEGRSVKRGTGADDVNGKLGKTHED